MEKDKILIEIAAYHDSELLNTINSALIQADYPERVCFSICYQDGDKEEYEILKKIKNSKIKYLDKNQIKGLCYARTICQSMIEDEKYIYQIDSHMRFVKHWDTKMIEALLSLNDSKAIISFYPPDCNGEMLNLSLDDAIFNNPCPGGKMYVDDFRSGNNPFVIFRCDLIENENSVKHSRTPFISGGNFFSFSQVHKEVFQHSKMYFFGDELFMAINLFTHGWNVYSSNISYIYHQYNRGKRKFLDVENSMAVEKQAFLELLAHKNDKDYLKELKIGTVRTIDEFERYSGIDFENRTLYLNAVTGDMDNEEYRNTKSYIRKGKSEEEKRIIEEGMIDVLVVDLFHDYKECIKSCLDKASKKEKIQFIVGAIKEKKPSKKEIANMNIKKFISFDENYNYSQILHEISSEVNGHYVALVDSSIRFISGWDEYSRSNLNMCGTKAALTSWVFTEEGDNGYLETYFNAEFHFQELSDYLPVLKYNESLDFSTFKTPYQTAIPFNGFLFMYSNILKQVEIDPNLSYDEQKYIYAIRLWTHGINIYIPQASHFFRNKLESSLSTENKNKSAVCALSGINCSHARYFKADYPFDIGKERPLWTWYKFVNINYDIHQEKII